MPRTVSMFLLALIVVFPPANLSNAANIALPPSQIRDYYDVSPLIQAGYTGTGVTVAIVGQGISTSFYNDMVRFDTMFGLPPANLTVVRPFGVNGGEVTSDLEPTFDTEVVHMMAPGARILLVLTGNYPPFYEGFSWVINKSAADIVSGSYSQCVSNVSDAVNVTDRELQESVKENITLISASRDSGANNTIAPNFVGAHSCFLHSPIYYINYSQYITVVGGTELTLYSDGSIRKETGWNYSSGGPSAFGRPVWQNAPGVPSGKWRDVPDVSMLASCQIGYNVLVQGISVKECGTSLSAPAFAGIMADVEQAAGHRLGLLNPYIYSFQSRDRGVFHDITSGCSLLGRNSTFSTGYCAGSGWDFVTGLGSPNAVKLLQYFVPSSKTCPTHSSLFDFCPQAWYTNQTLVLELAVIVAIAFSSSLYIRRKRSRFMRSPVIDPTPFN